MSDLLDRRHETHGNFHEVAKISTGIKKLIELSPNAKKLTDSQLEALSMISSKIARILCGNPNYRDHWDDIAGYAELGASGTVSVPDQIERDIAAVVNQLQETNDEKFPDIVTKRRGYFKSGEEK